MFNSVDAAVSRNTGTTRVIQFCGHRLYVHRAFQLYLTTTTPLSAMSSSLRSDLSVINLPPSVPLAQDILLDEAWHALLPQESTGFGPACEEIARGKQRLGELEEDVFTNLPKEGRMDNYWHATEEIGKIVEQKNEVFAPMFHEHKNLARLYWRSVHLCIIFLIAHYCCSSCIGWC